LRELQFELFATGRSEVTKYKSLLEAVHRYPGDPEERQPGSQSGGRPEQGEGNADPSSKRLEHGHAIHG
jgi:hypothetical protein